MTHALVRVIEERPVSLALAEQVGVKHESPQSILIQNRKPIWHDSHRALTADAFRAAVQRMHQ